MGYLSKQELLESSLTKAELIDLIRDLDDGDPVLLCCDYGDRGSTQQVLPLKGINSIHTSDIESSGYSQSGFALIDDDDDFAIEENQEESPLSLIILKAED